MNNNRNLVDILEEENTKIQESISRFKAFSTGLITGLSLMAVGVTTIIVGENYLPTEPNPINSTLAVYIPIIGTVTSGLISYVFNRKKPELNTQKNVVVQYLTPTEQAMQEKRQLNDYRLH